MQWTLPPPSRISRPGTPTTSRPGNTRRSLRSAAPSRRGSSSGTTIRLRAEVEVHVGGGQTRRPPRAAACPRPHRRPRPPRVVMCSGPGWTQLVHLEAPAARVARAASAARSASREISYCGSLRSSVQVSTTSPGLTNAQRLSTWPSVSSRCTPRPSQTTTSTLQVALQPVLDLARASSCGLRLRLSRHSSVVISVPCPSTWIAPPSSTNGAR